MQIVIGQYIPTGSWIHRLDPRTKLMSLILIIVTTFVIKELTTMAAMLVLTLILVQTSRIPLTRFLRGIAPLMILLVFTVIFQVLFNHDGDLLYSLPVFFTWVTVPALIGIIVLYNLVKRKIKFRFLFFILTLAAMVYALTFNFGPAIWTANIHVHSGGVIFAAFLITRILILISISSLLTLTTKPTDLNNGLEEVMKPLKRLKVPTEEISMMISIALRFIPTLLDEANKIMKAQASRGVDFQEGTLRQKITQIISLLIPMFIISFKRADDLANAMEARGYYPGKLRSKLVEFHYRPVDYVVMVVVVLLIPGVIYFGL